jgi:hypothetical protein
MLAYANPEDPTHEQKPRRWISARQDSTKQQRTITFECWPRFSNVRNGDKAQFPRWPITVAMQDNDGRTPVGWLPEIQCKDAPNVVVQVVEESTGNVLYTVRLNGPKFQPPVYADGVYTIKIGANSADIAPFKNLKPAAAGTQQPIQVELTK